jgi:hypothetical protein
MSTKTDSAIYSEKPIATYEAQYRENPVAKPQDIELTITAESIHGKAFKVEQIATMEEEVYYSRFANKISDISKISINTYIKDKPIYISFITENATNKNAKDRRRIVIPSLPTPETIVEQIIEIKSKLKNYDSTKARRTSDALEAKRRADEEFERKFTSEFEPEQVQNTEGLLGSEEKIKREIDFTISDNPVTNSKNDDTVADLLLDAPPAPEEKAAPEKKKRPAPIPAPDDFEDPAEIEAVEIAEEPKAAEIPEAAETPAAKIPEKAKIPEPETVKAPEPESVKEPEAVKAPEPAKAPAPEAVKALAPEAVKTPAPEAVKAPEPAKKAEAAPEPAAAPKAANVSSMSLSEFETAIKKLKVMREEGLLTDEEFAAEKRKVLTNLY